MYFEYSGADGSISNEENSSWDLDDDLAIVNAFRRAIVSHNQTGETTGQKQPREIASKSRACQSDVVVDHGAEEENEEDHSTAESRFASLLENGLARAHNDLDPTEGVPGPWTEVERHSCKQSGHHEDKTRSNCQSFGKVDPATLEQNWTFGQPQQPAVANPPLPNMNYMPPPPPPSAPGQPGVSPYTYAMGMDSTAAESALAATVPNDDCIIDLCMAWYHCGYFTGRYRARREQELKAGQRQTTQSGVL
mmetsp:Transcript_19646/g.30921  ORF Transcript_19646/g.30921 Transcript_19646/m.30921 type:complete len:250 (-) Transcript_19646:110-859(-)